MKTCSPETACIQKSTTHFSAISLLIIFTKSLKGKNRKTDKKILILYALALVGGFPCLIDGEMRRRYTLAGERHGAETESAETVNIILFEPHEAEKGSLPRADRRACHLFSVLRAGPGDRFAAGILNGRKGSLEILSVNAENLSFRFIPGGPPLALLPLDIIVGLPRPLVTGRLIKDLACLGLRSLHFVRAALCEKSYLSGSLWQKQEYRQYLLEGLQQSGTTLMPEVRLHERFDSCLACFPAASDAPGNGDSCRCVLDQRGEIFLRDVSPRGAAVLSIGPERGWTETELEKFKTAGFLVCRMGPRILRTEAAALAASTLMLSRMGFM